MSPSEVIGWLNRIFWRKEYKIGITKNPEPLIVKKLHVDAYHKIQQSRLRDEIAVVEIDEHIIYHKLFRNMTPREIVGWLNGKYWGNEYEINIRERIV